MREMYEVVGKVNGVTIGVVTTTSGEVEDIVEVSK